MDVSHFACACLLCAALRQAWQCTGVESHERAKRRNEDAAAARELLSRAASMPGDDTCTARHARLGWGRDGENPKRRSVEIVDHGDPVRIV